MKILPIIRDLWNGVNYSESQFKCAAVMGGQIAARTASIYKQGCLTKYVNYTRSISRQVVQTTTTKDLPYLAGAISIVPTRLLTPMVEALGSLAKASKAGAYQIYANQSKAHIDINM